MLFGPLKVQVVPAIVAVVDPFPIKEIAGSTAAAVQSAGLLPVHVVCAFALIAKANVNKKTKNRKIIGFNFED